MTNSLVQQLFDIDLWLVGAAHLVILFASFQVPYRLGWKQDLQQLMPFNRKLLWVQSGFTVNGPEGDRKRNAVPGNYGTP